MMTIGNDSGQILAQCVGDEFAPGPRVEVGATPRFEVVEHCVDCFGRAVCVLVWRIDRKELAVADKKLNSNHRPPGFNGATMDAVAHGSWAPC